MANETATNPNVDDADRVVVQVGPPAGTHDCEICGQTHTADNIGLSDCVLAVAIQRDEARAEFSRVKKQLATLVDYVLVHAPEDMQPGLNAAAIAIAWHKELRQYRDANRLKVDRGKCRNLANAPATAAPTANEPDWRGRLRQCATILELIEDMPPRAEEFAASVAEGVENVQEWISEAKTVTTGQCRALDNWQRGVERWLEND